MADSAIGIALIGAVRTRWAWPALCDSSSAMMRTVWVTLLGLAILGLVTRARRPVVCALAIHRSPGAVEDRQLVAILASVDTIAARYREYVRAQPRESDSLDATRTYVGRPDRAYRYCRAILRQQVMRAYQIPAAQLARVTPSDGPPRAVKPVTERGASAHGVVASGR